MRNLLIKINKFRNKLLFRKLFDQIKSKESGVAALEASFTLPILLIIIFFIIEFMRINQVRTAMDTLALKGTLYFTEYGDIAAFTGDRRNEEYKTKIDETIKGFDDIIKKYKPIGISESRIKYYFTIYDSLESMCSVAPYGNAEVYWPSESGKSIFVDSNRDSSFLTKGTNTSSQNINLTNQSNPKTTTVINSVPKISGKVFILTFVCDYPFSSPFVEKLFAGGSNTKLALLNQFNSIPKIQEMMQSKIMLALEIVGKFLGTPENARADEIEDLKKQRTSLQEELNEVIRIGPGPFGGGSIQKAYMDNLLSQIDSLNAQIAKLEAAKAAQDVENEYKAAQKSSSGRGNKFIVYGRGVGVCE